MTTIRTTPGRSPLATLALLPLAAALAVGACGGEPDGDVGDAGAPDPVAEPPATGDTPSDTATPDGAAAGAGVELPTLLDRAFERDEEGRLTVLRDMSEPTETSVRAVQNRHDPTVTDTIRTLRWDGLELEIHAAGGTKEILSSVRVTSEGYATADGLSVGLGRERVRELRGEPVRTEDETWVYEVYESEEDPLPTTLRVAFEEDRVRSLEWGYYVD